MVFLMGFANASYWPRRCVILTDWMGRLREESDSLLWSFQRHWRVSSPPPNSSPPPRSLQWSEPKWWVRSFWGTGLLERCATQSSKRRWANVHPNANLTFVLIFILREGHEGIVEHAQRLHNPPSQLRLFYTAEVLHVLLFSKKIWTLL